MKENTFPILLCEDNEDLGIIFKDYLISKNYQVDLFFNAYAAMSSFEKFKYTMCISDFRLFDDNDLMDRIHTCNPDCYVLVLLYHMHL